MSIPPAGWFPAFSTRSDQTERMEAPVLDEEKAWRTLRQFRIVNRLFSRSQALMREIFVPHMLRAPGTRFTLLDIGAGGGDVATRFSALCSSLGIPIDIVCLDNDPRAVRYARRKTRHVGNITVRTGSAENIASLGIDIDYISANHLLHHLRDEAIPPFLNRLYRTARRGFLVNDLVRSPPAYLGFALFAAVFLRGSYHFHDGRVSIKRGFTVAELEKAVAASGLGGRVRVGRKIPARAFIYSLKHNAG